MPHRKDYKFPHADIREPDIAQHLRIPQLRVPEDNEFSGMVKAEDLIDLETRDRKTVLAMSVLEQWSDWHTEHVVSLYVYVRQLEAEVVRRKLDAARMKASQEQYGWQMALAKWAAVTIVAGIISAWFRHAFEK